MNTTMKALTCAAALAAILGVEGARADEPVTYEVRFDADWTARSHPLDYPGNAHFSGLIGATHGDDYRIFVDGGTATAGLEALSERGAHSPLNTEIEEAIASGKAGALFESAPLFKFPGTLSATFTADDAHPNASVVAMIAPSPDWFTGVSNVPLKMAEGWVEQMTYTLFAWDAGTDGGTTYAAPDADTMPRQSVRLNVAPHFKNARDVIPVGTVTFTRIMKTATN